MYIPAVGNTCFINASKIQSVYVYCPRNTTTWYVGANVDFSEGEYCLAGPFETSKEAKEELQRIVTRIENCEVN